MWLRVKSLLLQNQNLRQTVAKNTFWLFFGQTVSRLIRTAIIIYAARVLGAEQWGVFAYALSVAALFTVLIDFGINAIITRESSRDLAIQERYFATALAIKLAMFAVVALILVLGMPVLVRQAEVRALLWTVVLIIGFDSFKDFGAALSRAWEKMEIEAGIHILTNAAIVVAGFLALWLSPTPGALAWGYAVGTGVGMLVSFLPFRRYFQSLRQNFSWQLVRPIFVSCWPLALMGILGGLMLNTDTIMIGWFRDTAQVGYYAAAQRIGQLIYILPGLVAAALFPSLAKFAADRDRFRSLLDKSLTMLSLIAVPAMIGGVILAQKIIVLLFGSAYAPAAASFFLMNLTYLPVFLAANLGNAVFALNQERKLFGYFLIGAVGNAAFNLLFIPWLGITGAALSTLVNQIIATSFLFFILRRETSLAFFRQTGKIFLAALVMGVGVYLLELNQVPVLLNIAAGAIIYLVMLRVARETLLIEAWNTVRGR
ncbi:MAG: flippase [Candidatus Liptonbacteria bacterium]|nr:flippase [Candidatus Liptonbacteria bacterium]